MTIKVNREKKEITLSVRDLASYGIPRKTRRGIFFRSAEEGQEIHSQIQTTKQRDNPNYKQEYYVKHSLTLLGWQVNLRGRIDLLLKTPHMIKIEEIKSFYVKHYKSSPDDPQTEFFRWQLLFYAWVLMHHEPTLPHPVLCLILVNRYDNQQYDIDIPFEDVTREIHNRIQQIITIEEEKHQRHDSKVESLQYLKFPFPYRPYQEEITQKIQEVLNQGLCLIIEAPSGMGKTVVSLYPLLEYAISKETKLFFLTAKTTQRRIVEKTLQIFRKQGVDFLAVVLRAKEKMCTNDFYFCHEEFCPFLQAQMRDNSDQHREWFIKQRGVVSPEEIEQKARETEGFCPFEMALDLSLEADVIIGDYNYVFHPRVVLQRFFGESIPKNVQYFLLIDEAHNLVDRSLTYYSHSLLQREIVSFKRALRQLKRKFKGISLPIAIIPELEKLFRDLQTVISSQSPDITTHVIKTTDLPISTLKAVILQYEDDITLYIRYLVENDLHWPDDPVLLFYYHLRNLVETAITLPLYPDEFTILFNSHEGELKILCKDASVFLSQRLKRFHSVIGISATISPFHFYRDLLGFPIERTVHQRYPSPFPPDRRKVLVMADVDTRYAQRSHYFATIAEFLQKATQIKPGRYFVFFPSFVFAEKVLEHLPTRTDQLVLKQSSYMPEKDRIKFIHDLENNSQVLAIGVTSGIFAEGIDLPGILDGVFVISPSLPPVSVEREVIRNYFDDKFNDGFAYAYQFPGLTRTFQAAGRLIRSTEDLGIIVFIGHRFATSAYAAHFPSYYYQSHPRELVSSDPLREIKSFWRFWEIKASQGKAIPE